MLGSRRGAGARCPTGRGKARCRDRARELARLCRRDVELEHVAERRAVDEDEPLAIGRPVRTRAKVGQEPDVRWQVIEGGAIERSELGIARRLSECGGRDEDERGEPEEDQEWRPGSLHRGMVRAELAMGQGLVVGSHGAGGRRLRRRRPRSSRRRFRDGRQPAEKRNPVNDYHTSH